LDKLLAYFGSHPSVAGGNGCATCIGKLAIFDESYLATTRLPLVAPYSKFTYTWHLMSNSRRGKKVQLIGGSHVSIPTAAKNRDEAWKLSEHLVSDESIKTLFDGCGFLLATRPLLENPDSMIDPKRYPGLDWHFSSVKEADETRSYAACPITNVVGAAWDEACGAVGHKQKTIDQALGDLQERCTNELASILKA